MQIGGWGTTWINSNLNAHCILQLKVKIGFILFWFRFGLMPKV